MKKRKEKLLESLGLIEAVAKTWAANTEGQLAAQGFHDIARMARAAIEFGEPVAVIDALKKKSRG